jgi:TldD protein
MGQLQVAGPQVTITANRSAPTQLATVNWDDEGVRPEPFALIHNGVLVDFQTTREQAPWLDAAYQRRRQSVRSHGCAAAESGLAVTLQHMPNLALEPGSSALTVQDLIANVTTGILIENGRVETDFQVAGGMVKGSMQEITNGRLGPALTNGAIYFNTLDLWKNIIAIAGVATQTVRAESQYGLSNADLASYKGQPGQATSHSTSGVAATIANQPLIDPTRSA